MNWLKEWVPLSELQEDSVGRGTIFRFPASDPYEDVVDYMIVESRESETSFALMVSTGFKAGITCQFFPAEARAKEGGISTSWLKANWEKWIYQGCRADQVRVIWRYPSGFGSE